jgi:hypothetical protein
MTFVYAFALLIYVIFAVPLTAVAVFAVYAVWLPVLYFTSLWRVLIARPPELSPPELQLKTPANADPAVLQYFYGPALADADQAIRDARDSGRDFWQRGADAIRGSFTGEGAIWRAPFGAGGAVGMAAGTAVGAVVAAVLALIQLATIGVTAVLARLAGTALRAADSVVLRVKNIRMVCPSCYERVPYPGYECPGQGCTRRHRDIRPGRFGIVRRRCQCGTTMSTLLLFGSGRMNAYCPRCGNSLEYRPGHAREIVLPFFGATGAGKTRLLFAMVTQLRMWSQQLQPDFVAEFGDAATRRKLADADRWLSPETATDKTPAEPPRGYIIQMMTKGDPRILHMFDAAGELFYTAERTQELRYLHAAQTFILVIDPLSVEAFWDRLQPDQQAKLKPARSAAPSPDLAYAQAHQEIEAMGVRLAKARLAVVFSRADLIGAPDGDVAGWATAELGLGNLVRSARLTFDQACFFRTAAVMSDGVMHPSVPELLRWVLARNDFALPEGAGPQLAGKP